MDLDITFLFQFGLFLVCLVGLNGLILKPFLRVIEERDQKIEGAREETTELQKLGDEDMDAYQARMRQARFKAAQVQEGLRNEGRDTERALLAETRARIAEELNRARQHVERAEMEARKGLAGESDDLARQLVSKILDREVAA